MYVCMYLCMYVCVYGYAPNLNVKEWLDRLRNLIDECECESEPKSAPNALDAVADSGCV